MNILREREVEARTKLDRVTIWRRERAGTFPKRVQIGRQSIGWIESEIDAWIASLPRGPISYKDLNINSEAPAA
jgi:prophage regulatory protein